MTGKSDAAIKKAEDLDNSRLLDVHRHSDYPEVDAAVEAVWLLVDQSGRQNIRKKHIKLVVLDLYVAWLTDQSMWIAFYRRKDEYKSNQRYNKLHITHTTIKVVDILNAANLIDHVKGHHVRESGGNYLQSHMSRMRAKPSLIALISTNRVMAESGV